MSSSLPPPPKMSGVNTPSGGSSSQVASKYQIGGSTKTPKKSTVTPTKKVNTPNILSTSYETYAPRTTEQRARLARIASLTAGPSAVYAGEEKVNDNETDESIVVTLAEAMCPPISSSMSNNLDKKLSPVDESIHTTLQQTLNKTQNLSTLIKHTAKLRLALHASLNIANDVSARHADLLRHSGELSAAAERLQHEEQVLTKRATEIGLPLQHYDAVDSIGILVGILFKDGGRVTVRGIPKINVNDNMDEFVTILSKIDDAVEFFGDSGGAEVFGRPGSSATGVGGRGRRPSGAGDNRRKEKLTKEQAFDVHASGSAEYYRRACALQDAALELLRVGVADRITQTSNQIQDALHIPKVSIAADKLEASLVYTRYHGISKRSNALISIARKRLDALGNGSVAATSYEDLLTLCRNTYCLARETLLTTTVRTHMDILKERHGLVGMTRLASVFLIRLCTVETALYLDFFGDAKKKAKEKEEDKDAVDEEKESSSGEGNDMDDKGTSSTQLKRMGSSTTHPAAAALASQVLSEDATYRDAEFQSMLSALCSSLHRTIRRGLVSVLDLDVLCQVVSVLREERSAANSSPTTLAAARAVSAVIQDAQERLIFCANNALHKEVARFKPTPNDLNYPGKLLGEKPKTTIIIDDDDEEANADTEGDKKENEAAEDKKEDQTPVDDAVAAQLRVYESWFPPMRSVLRILSKIFRVVEPRVFEDIALQSVQSCTKSLKDGSIFILRNSGQIHADLFLVKHLLILREQLSPFDIQLRSVERQLDFSEAGKAVTRFLANRNRRLFSMSTENALVTLLREGVSVQESSVDSKRDLEDCLRSACNDFIEHTSASLLGPIAGLVDQCKSAESTSTDLLIKAPFMNGVLVKGVFSNANESLDGQLEDVSKQMSLYLENTATQGILMKPVVRKINRSLEEAKRFIGETTDGENDWDAELRADIVKSLEEFESKVKIIAKK